MRNYMLAVLIGVFLCSCMVTPRPLTMQDIEQRAENDFQTMFADQEPVTGPITLYEATARAIRYNLDHRLRLMEEMLAARQLDVSRYDLLPQLTASAGYDYRNKYSGAYSESLIDGSQSLVASTSRERNVLTTDISMMWNVLDFGVSYVRANQQADRVLISVERRRKVVQNITQDVCDAYWRAASSERLLPKMDDLLKLANAALERSEKVAEQRLKPPHESLEYQRSLLENIRLLWGLIQRLRPAKAELAVLMNLPPGTPYQLAEPDWESPNIPSFEHVETLEHLAMIYRPELREEDYKRRITTLETRKAILEMLPGITLDFGYNYDSNNFLYNQSWWDAGARISLNLFNLLSGPVAYRAAQARGTLDDVRRKALSMAVLTQVHLAFQRYQITKEEYGISRRLDEVNSQLDAQIAKSASAGGADDATVIRSATNALLANMRHHLAYAELRNAAARIHNSIGIDLLPTDIESPDIELLSQALEHAFDEWSQQINETPVP